MWAGAGSWIDRRTDGKMKTGQRKQRRKANRKVGKGQRVRKH